MDKTPFCIVLVACVKQKHSQPCRRTLHIRLVPKSKGIRGATGDNLVYPFSQLQVEE